MDVDLALIERARTGDAAAMDTVLSTVRPLVLKRCARLLPYPQDAEEAAQDALLSIALKLQTWSGSGVFEAWAGAIATNQARMTYRSMKRRHEERGLDQAPERVDPARTSVIAGSRVDLLEALEALEERHPETVDAFVLRDLTSMAYDDIAAVTGAPLGTVKARIHTARTFLRGRLAEV